MLWWTLPIKTFFLKITVSSTATDRFFSRHRKIVIKKPSVRTGKFRFHGTGDFHAWFAKDFERHKRDGMFIAFIRRQWWRIGFTVERSDAVMKIFQERGLIRPAGKHPLLTNRKKVCR